MPFEHRTPTILKSPQINPEIAGAYERAQKILNVDAIDPKKFIDLYGEINVERDLQTVAQIEAGFENDETKQIAEILEVIIYEHAELSNWLGQNTETIRPSRYDDLVNGVDLIAQFNDENSTKHLALGIDITFGSQSMRKKFNRIRNEIHDDKLAEVKYFESHGFKGSLKQLPRVVIGVEFNTVKALAGLWMARQDKTLGSESKKEIATRLDTHFVRDIIIAEIEKQIRSFLLYAQSIGSFNAVKSYTYALNMIKNVRMNVVPAASSSARNKSVETDKVYLEIQKQLEDFRVTSR